MLFLLVLVVGGLTALYWPTPRRRAMERVEALGGTVVVQTDEEGGVHSSRIVMLSHRPVSLEDLAALHDLRPVHRVILDGSPVTDEGLACLARLEELELLSLSKAPITDAGLTHLSHLSHLRSLSLGKTPVTDAGLIHLRPLTSLVYLSVESTRVTDRGVQELCAAIPGLKVYHPGLDEK
jgi:hypothetical protein